MVEGFAKVIKYALFAANCIIVICGLGVFSVGVWTLADHSFVNRLLGSDLFMSSTVVLIVSGVMITITSFLGCFGALKEIKCMLLTFFIILFMVFIVLLVGGILAFVFRQEVEKRMQQEMIATIPRYQNETAVKDSWDTVQKTFKCCGLVQKYNSGYSIWGQLNTYFQGATKVPVSCCRKTDSASVKQCQADPKVGAFSEDCYAKMKDFISKHALILGGVGVGIACVLIIGMMLSCALFLMIN